MKRFALLACLLGCAHAATDRSPDVLEETRALGQGALVEAAQSGDLETRKHALRVIARLQRPETIDAVKAALTDPAVAREAAFAAGQFGLAWQPLDKPVIAALEASVREAFTHLTDPAARAACLEALGKLAQPASAATLVAALGDADENVRRSAAQSLGLLAYGTRGESPDLSAIDPLNALIIHDASAEVRYAAAYALMRMKKPEARPGLVYGIKDADARVRGVCARGLADVALEPELPYLLERLTDKDLAVRVEAARSLGKLAGTCEKPGCAAAAAAQSALLALASGALPEHPETAMPLLALVQEKLPATLADALEQATRAIPEAKTPLDARGRTVLMGYIAAAADRTRTDGTTPLLAKLAQSAWRDTLVVRTLSDSAADPKLKAKVLLALPVTCPQVAGAVDDALGELKSELPAAHARVLADLENPDWFVVLSAADAAGKMGMKDAILLLHRALTMADVNAQDDALATVLGHLTTLGAPDAKAIALRYANDPRPTVRAGALEALKNANLPTGEPMPRDFHGARTSKEVFAQVTTERGEIRMKLHANSFTAQNFVNLAERGYFDGLDFHRIVPGFVAQAGDPRGDGSGGPGYTIPCELDASRYVRGAVGMALSGKDTGGSQFFITLAPQPHLEGRYTIFAEVTAGMESADALMEGDRILSVRIEP